MSTNLKVKVDLRKMETENPEFKGFADLTIGDFAIKGVSVFENEGEDGKKHLNFTMPSRVYEAEDGTKKYVNAVEIYNSNEDFKKAIVGQIRSTIREALNKKEPDRVLENGDKQTPIYSAEKESNLQYFDTSIKPVDIKTPQYEGYSSLKATGSLLVGGVLRINDVILEEYESNGEMKTNIHFQKGDKYIDKDGKEQYPEKVFPIKEGLKNKLCELMEEAYIEKTYQNEEKQDVKVEEQESENEEM